MIPLLRVVNLSKTFGTLPAIKEINFEIQRGEVVGLTGSVGSGKSVLVMLLAGLYEPNEGEVYFADKRLSWPFAANSLGIGVIHQRPTLAENFDIVENIFMGNELYWPMLFRPFGILNHNRMEQEAVRILSMLEVKLGSIHDRISNLSGEQRQLIAIARVLSHPTRMVIIDEPTIMLSYPYQQKLLSLIQSWREQGVAVLFSSNNLDHLFAVTDRIIILHQGRKVADLQTDETTRESVVNLLIGTRDPQKPSSSIWHFDSYERIREHTEKLRYHQMLLEKDLAAEDTFNRQLTKQLAEQVQILDQANIALLEAQRRLLSEREEERKHLAREIHDQVIQDLLSINYELEDMQVEPTMSSAAADELLNVRQGIRDLVDNLRRLCSDLRPPTIDYLGLGAAIQSYTRDWSARTDILVELNVDANLGRMPEETELSIFRIIQEGLNNIWRHSHATRVQIDLQHTSPRTLMVSLSDNGQGLNEELDLNGLVSEGHFGLMGISERVALLGGRFKINRSPEGGMMLMVEIPHPRVDVSLEVVRS